MITCIQIISRISYLSAWDLRLYIDVKVYLYSCIYVSVYPYTDTLLKHSVSAAYYTGSKLTYIRFFH